MKPLAITLCSILYLWVALFRHRPPLNRRAKNAKAAEAGYSRAIYRSLPFQPDDKSSGVILLADAVKYSGG
jgi:hypothetical protein